MSVKPAAAHPTSAGYTVELNVDPISVGLYAVRTLRRGQKRYGTYGRSCPHQVKMPGDDRPHINVQPFCLWFVAGGPFSHPSVELLSCAAS
jgi:hypothetical protein